MIGSTLLGRVARPLVAVALALLAQPALATINCEILPVGPTTLDAEIGSTLDVSFDVTGIGCGTSIVTGTTVITDTTGSAVSDTLGTGPAGRRLTSAFIGTTPGSLVFRVTCISGCFGSPSNQQIDYAVNVTPVRTLEIVGPPNFSEEEGATRAIRVRALDNGLPAGTVVFFNVTGPVSVSPTSVNTDANGEATVLATFGPGTGSAVVTANRLDDPLDTVSFGIDVVPVQPRSIFKISGDGQAARTGGNLIEPLVVEVRDSGVPSAGIGMVWTVESGDATIVAATSPTDGSGRAETDLLLGPTESNIVVRATRADDATVFTEFSVSSFITRGLSAQSGSGQSGEVGAVLPQPFVVEATNNGVPTPGITINWSIATGGGTLVSTTTVTDASGIAQTGLQLPSSPGTVTVIAQRADDGDFQVSFTADALPIPPRSISSLSGDGQSAQTGTAVAAPLVIETRDLGVPSSGVGINWSVVAGDATLVASTSPTDATGRAQTGVLFGSTPGVVTVRAVRADDATVGVNFNLASFTTRTLTVVSGDNQSGPPDSVLPLPLVAELRDNGLPKVGAAVTWTVDSGGALLQSTTLITDASGRVQATLRLPPVNGPSVITVRVVGDPTTSLSFNATSGTVTRTIAIVSGDGQTGATNTPLAQPLVVETRDNGVPAAGVGLVWSIVGDATLVLPESGTNGVGRAQTGVLFGASPSSVTVRATRTDDTTVWVEFNISSTLTRTLARVSGDGQTALTGTAIAAPLVIEALDNGVATAGIGIIWSIDSGDATLVTPTSPTDATGRAQTGLLFGPTPGPVVIRATRIDDTTVQTAFTVTSTLTRTLVPVNGNSQTGPTGTPASNPLVVEARDNGTPSAGIGLTWSVVSGDATITAAGSPTNASGQAQASVTFGATPGPIVIRAARTDDATVVADFTLTSTLTRTLALISGNGQSAPTNSALPSPLIIEARDNGIATGGIVINWSVVSGAATLATPTSPTDAAGRAQTGLLFGATPGPVVVRATRADDATATTDFTVTSTLTRTITLISGGNQLGIPGLPLPNPIVLEVRSNGQPEAGISVNIEVEGDASLSGDGVDSKIVRVTDGTGRVSAVVTLGPNSSGLVSVQASVPASPGVSTTVAATANSLANVPGLTGPQRELGTILQLACGAIAQLPITQRTPEQIDLLARCQEFAGANPDEIADALDELRPDTSLAMVNVALQAGQAQLDNLKARIAALRSGTQGSSFGGLAIATPAGALPVTGLVQTALGATEDEPEAGAEFDRWGYFVSGTIGRGEAEPGRLTPAYDFDINGLTAGIDYRFNDGFVAGASIGYTKQDTALTGGEGNVDADGYSLSAYATFYRDQSWYTDAVLTWGRNDYETQRRIRYTLTGPGGTATIDQTARGQLDGDLLSAAGTVGRDYQVGTWSIGPYGRVLYSRIDFDAGREVISGAPGSGLALEIFPGAHTSLASVVGTKFSTALSRDWGILMPHLQVEWEHEYRDDPQRVGARFLADPNAAIFNVEGDAIDSSFFRLGGGLSVLFAGGRSGFFYVERVIGKSGFSQTNFALGIRGEF